MPPLYKAMPSRGKEEYLYDDKALEKYRKTHKEKFTLQRYKGLGEMGPGAALGDDTESGDETFEACGDRGCPYGLRCDGSTDGNRGSAAESIYL